MNNSKILVVNENFISFREGEDVSFWNLNTLKKIYHYESKDGEDDEDGVHDWVGLFLGFVYFVKEMTQLLLVGDKGLELFHLGLVARLGDEELEVAVGRVFLVEVLEGTLPVPFFV